MINLYVKLAPVLAQNVDNLFHNQDEYAVGLSMRFPRIKKVRLESVDGDEKKASETSTDEEIWRIFDEARSKRLDLDSIIRTQSQLGLAAKHIRQGCRFLTPEEFRKKVK